MNTTFIAWLIAASIGTALFLCLVLGGVVFTLQRSVRRAGAESPSVVLFKKYIGPLLKRFGRRSAAGEVHLVGAVVWLEWDQRSGAHGEGVGRVVREIARATDSALLISTDIAQPLPEGPTTSVWFIPQSADDLRAFGLSGVGGSLRPGDNVDPFVATDSPDRPADCLIDGWLTCEPKHRV